MQQLYLPENNDKRKAAVAIARTIAPRVEQHMGCKVPECIFEEKHYLIEDEVQIAKARVIFARANVVDDPEVWKAFDEVLHHRFREVTNLFTLFHYLDSDSVLRHKLGDHFRELTTCMQSSGVAIRLGSERYTGVDYWHDDQARLAYIIGHEIIHQAHSDCYPEHYSGTIPEPVNEPYHEGVAEYFSIRAEVDQPVARIERRSGDGFVTGLTKHRISAPSAREIKLVITSKSGEVLTIGQDNGGPLRAGRVVLIDGDHASVFGVSINPNIVPLRFFSIIAQETGQNPLEFTATNPPKTMGEFCDPYTYLARRKLEAMTV